MAKKKTAIEMFQHFRYKHKGTGETFDFSIGPTPISLVSFERQCREAVVAKSKDPDAPWLIDKAWEGPRK